MNAAHAVWARPQLIAQVLRNRRDGQAEVLLRVRALDSPRRVLRLQQALSALPGVHRVLPDATARRVRITFNPDATALPRLLDTCAACGLAAEPLTREFLDDTSLRAHDDALKRLLVAGIFAMQAMMFASVLYLGLIDPIDTSTLQLFRWLGLLAAAPVVTWAAWPFYRRSVADLRARRIGIDAPIALAALLIYAASVVSAVRGQGEVYFDSVSMFIFVLLLGRYLHLRAHRQHGALGQAAADALPLVCQRRDADGTLQPVAVAELNAGDRVHVADGQCVPVDGVLSSAQVRLDESRQSGESRPRTRHRGETVHAGSLVLEGPLELRVRETRVAHAGRLHALLESAQRTLRNDYAERGGARRFTLRLLALVLVTALGWLIVDPARAFDAAVAVLVVACPCAFALAAPATLTRAMALLARTGVLVTRARALPLLAHADTVLLDKTGTLTEPGLDLKNIHTFRDCTRAQALRWAAALARESSHPLARAIARDIDTREVPAAEQVQVVASGGIRGFVEGRALRLGRGGFAHAGNDDDALWLADDAGPLACLPLNETLRPDAPATVSALRDMGLHPMLVSGDARERVQAVATRLGIDAWHARLEPADKQAAVQAAQNSGAVVLMLGDGGNDVTALAAADVSASLTGGTDLARAHADLLLTATLDGLPQARRLSERALRVLAQNRNWALAYNLLATPFAAVGLVPPWLAVLAMALSSLGVVLNALRLRMPHTEAVDMPAPPATGHAT